MNFEIFLRANRWTSSIDLKHFFVRFKYKNDLKNYEFDKISSKEDINVFVNNFLKKGNIKNP